MKERIINAIKRKQTVPIPWVPFMGCHRCVLISVPAQAYHQSEDFIVNAATEAVKRHQFGGIPVTFGL